MRSYWMSLTFVAAVLCGYTAIVFTSHTPSAKANASTPAEPREPAAAATAATTEASTNVN